MLPGLFKDGSEMPENLRHHIRYPEDLFTVQAEMYGTYHMTNPTTFYNREDRWEVPRELHRDREIEVQPYYVMAQLPHAASPEFMLMLPLSVAGKIKWPDGWPACRMATITASSSRSDFPKGGLSMALRRSNRGSIRTAGSPATLPFGTSTVLA